MPNLINPALIGNWENWLRVFLMVAIGFSIFNILRRNSRKEG